MKLDNHGQPVFQSSRNYERLTDRVLDELNGICRGVILDGIVTQGEAEALLAWLERQHYAKKYWPSNVLVERLQGVLEDGRLDTEEARDLYELIREIVGGNGDAYGPETATIPFDKPQPDIVFRHRRFVVTGRFASGTRKTVTGMIEELGGEIKGNVSLLVDYLVCGHFSSRDWIHSSMGRKIEAAMLLRDHGAKCTRCGCKIYDTLAPCPKCGESDIQRCRLALVSEENWAQAVKAAGG